jgi:hypothetical protein
MGGDQLHELLGEGQEVLDPHELQKLIPGLWKGLAYFPVGKYSHSCPHSGFFLSPHAFIHLFVYCSSSLVDYAFHPSLH